MIILIVTIAIGIGIVALVSVRLKDKSQKSTRDYMIAIHYQDEKQYDVADWEKHKEVVSSDKIKQLKEKELEKKSREIEQKGQQNNKGLKKATVIMADTEKSARAGDVQRNGKEQFNLRKDEENNSESAEDSWWIK